MASVAKTHDPDNPIAGALADTMRDLHQLGVLEFHQAHMPAPLSPQDDQDLTNALIVMVQWFGPEAVGNLLNYIDSHGTRELRRRLAHISELNGGY